MNKWLVKKWFQIAEALIVGAMLWACSDDKVAGGSSDDAGVYAVKDLDVAGVSQKGPFVKGSAVTVQGIDCQTMELTGEIFEGTVKSNKGDFGVDDVNLSATCALFEVTGYYFNEVTGKKSADEVTLHALSDLSDRKHVNINMLTELEYKRVMNLVSEKKMSFADAKKQAEKEVLASFNVNGDYALSEDLNIFENGDGNAALLAVSVLVQVSSDSSKNVDVAERVDNFGTAIAENGSLDNSAKTEMADWAATAGSNGQMAKIRRNLENLGYAEEIASFENVVEEFAETVIPASSESSSSFAKESSFGSSSSSGETQSSSSSSVILSSSEESSKNTKDSYLNPEIEYGELTDARDGQVYKTVKIGNRTWMAQNLNYADSVKTPSLKGKSWCYDNKIDNCTAMGRLYTWAAAIDSVVLAKNGKNCGMGSMCNFVEGVQGICPDGWHVPSLNEMKDLFYAGSGMVVAWADVNTYENSGRTLRSISGWDDGKNGIDSLGFSIAPAGRREPGSAMMNSSSFKNLGSASYFWTSNIAKETISYTFEINAEHEDFYRAYLSKDMGLSIRCIEDDENVLSSSSFSSSSSEISSSSNEENLFDWSVPKEDYLSPYIEYGEMTDARDGRVYKTVEIGNQIWMAENLNYADSTETPSLKGKNWCFDNNPKKCETAGRLYSWAAAIDSVKLATDESNPQDCGRSKTCSLPTRVRGICPEGWHLPDTSEWRNLQVAVGWQSEALMSSIGWTMEGSGTDDVGFSAMPAGEWDYSYGLGVHDGNYTYFLSAQENGVPYVYVMELTSLGASRVSAEERSKLPPCVLANKSDGHSIRCVKD